MKYSCRRAAKSSNFLISRQEARERRLASAALPTTKGRHGMRGSSETKPLVRGRHFKQDIPVLSAHRYEREARQAEELEAFETGVRFHGFQRHRAGQGPH